MFFQLLLVVVLFGWISSEDQLGSKLSQSPFSGRNETLKQRMVVPGTEERGWERETEPVSLNFERTPGQHIRQRRTVLASDGRPLDYEFFRGVGYYKYYTKCETWEQARRICESEGGHLMIINSDSEIKVIRAFLERKLPVIAPTWNGVFHMGFSDHVTEGTYVTVLGEPLSSSGFTNWHPGAPHNEAWKMDTDSDCGLFQSTTLKLDDAPCSGILPFWCEMPL